MRIHNEQENWQLPELEEIERYLEGTLSQERTKVIEELISKEEIIRDAIDGYKWIDEPKEVRNRIKQLKKRTHFKIEQLPATTNSKSRRKYRVIPHNDLNQVITLISGIIIIGLIILFIYYLATKEEVADPRENNTQEVPAIEQQRGDIHDMPILVPIAGPDSKEVYQEDLLCFVDVPFKEKTSSENNC